MLKPKLRRLNRLDTRENVKQPSATRKRPLPQKEGSAPVLGNQLGRNDLLVADKVDASELRDLVKQYVASNPSGAARRLRKRSALFEDARYKEVVWYGEQIGHTVPFQVVAEEEKIGIVLGLDASLHRSVRAIEHFLRKL